MGPSSGSNELSYVHGANVSPFSPNVFSPGQFSQLQGYQNQKSQDAVSPFDDFGNDMIKIDGTTHGIDSSGNTGEDIALRTFDDASALIPPRQSPKRAGPINLVRNRQTSQGFFKSESRLLACFSCCKVVDGQKYFDVTTELVVERLRFAAIGHLLGMPRPAQVGMHGMDFDLYVPLWTMITLIVECSIVGFFNQSMSAYFRQHQQLPGDVEAITEAFSMESLTNLFFFVAFFFTVAPFFVYVFARVQLMD